MKCLSKVKNLEWKKNMGYVPQVRGSDSKLKTYLEEEGTSIKGVGKIIPIVVHCS